MNDFIPDPFNPAAVPQVDHWKMVRLPPQPPPDPMRDSIEIDGTIWQDYQLALDANNSLWRLTAYDMLGITDWRWCGLGEHVEFGLDDEAAVRRPLRKVWLINEKGIICDQG